MKNKFISTLILVCSLFLMCSCNQGGNKPSYPDPDPEIKERYNIVFKSNNEVVKEYANQVPGTYIDIPELPAVQRMTNTGWTNMTDKEFADKKVRVYENDAVYEAIWNEQFGTNTIYNSYGIKTSDKIEIDGNKDEAYDVAEKIQIAKAGVGASAEASVCWSSDELYIFIEVTDSTYYPHVKSEQDINSCDSVNLFLDILHDDLLAEKGYTTGWGTKYCGDLMCEAWFKISAGAQFTMNERYKLTKGSDFVRTMSMSNAARNSGTTLGTSISTAKGYNVEYRIDLSNLNIPTAIRNQNNKQFGLGIVLFDQTNSDYDTTKPCETKIGLEDINLESDVSPKRLSNFKCLLNPTEQTNICRVVKTRDCFPVADDLKRDDLFKDSLPTYDGNNIIESLYDDNKRYFYITKDENATDIKITFNGVAEPYNINDSTKIAIDVSKSEYFTFSYKVNGEEVLNKYCCKHYANSNNLESARKLFVSKKTDTPMLIDGVKDATYKEETKIDLNVQTFVERPGLAASGVAYTAWDDEYIYLFVEVTDPIVDSTTINTYNPELNDRVEFWISSTRVLPTAKTTWGPDNRPYYLYCGEGQFCVRAGMDIAKGVTGFHWMYDDTIGCPRTIVTNLIDGGYTVEMKIGWASFASEVKENVIIDIGLYICDGENNIRKGIVGTNYQSHLIYQLPYYMDHLRLEK